MQTAIIYLGMFFFPPQIFQFAVIGTSFSIVCTVPNKLTCFSESFTV